FVRQLAPPSRVRRTAFGSSPAPAPPEQPIQPTLMLARAAPARDQPGWHPTAISGQVTPPSSVRQIRPRSPLGPRWNAQPWVASAKVPSTGPLWPGSMLPDGPAAVVQPAPPSFDVATYGTQMSAGVRGTQPLAFTPAPPVGARLVTFGPGSVADIQPSGS